MFSNRDLKQLLIPLIIEQLLQAFMGMADTMMVANVGAAAVSGVALVDSVNTLVLYLFAALATGGTIVCSQYLGRQDRDGAAGAARQVLFSALALSLLMSALCIVFRRPLLRLIFGSVEPAVMNASLIYFFITALSYPFIALYNTSAALYRATGNSRLPMLISGGCNLFNIVGNAILIFGLDLGVAGAALSTLLSRVLSSVIILWFQRQPGQVLVLGRLTAIRPQWAVIALVLSVGIPTGLENGMFQLGKLMVQSTVSTLGTDAIAAQSIISMLELITSMPSMAVGLGLVTVAGQCMGAGSPLEARRYALKLTGISAGLVLVMGILIYAITEPVIYLADMNDASAGMIRYIMFWITVLKPFLWPLAFTPANAMRAAGDVNYALSISAFSMWVFRVGLSFYLCRFTSVGLMGVWIGMMTDWGFRAICFSWRYFRGRWMQTRVLKA